VQSRPRPKWGAVPFHRLPTVVTGPDPESGGQPASDPRKRSRARKASRWRGICTGDTSPGLQGAQVLARRSAGQAHPRGLLGRSTLLDDRAAEMVSPAPAASALESGTGSGAPIVSEKTWEVWEHRRGRAPVKLPRGVGGACSSPTPRRWRRRRWASRPSPWVAVPRGKVGCPRILSVLTETIGEPTASGRGAQILCCAFGEPSGRSLA
jgi:hypothetical protein